MPNVKLEAELYLPMVDWLKVYLDNKFRGKKCEIIALDSHAFALDGILEQNGVIEYFPQTVGLGIQIDVLGIVKWQNKSELYFIEAKKTSLNLHDLGQLWAYCKLCDPAEAFLLSSAGKGSLTTVIEALGREDLLDFGDGKKIKKMRVGKWDVARRTVDQHSLVPKL